MKKFFYVVLIVVVLFSASVFQVEAAGSYLDKTSRTPVISDAMKILSYIAGKTELTYEQKCRADADSSYTVTLTDVLRFFYVVAGKNETLVLPGDLYTDYFYENNSSMASVIGCEGSFNSPVAYADGTLELFHSYSGRTRYVTVGIKDIVSKIKWYKAEGWLPYLISEYQSRFFDVKVETFADSITEKGNSFEISYIRVTVENISDSEKLLPFVSVAEPINDAAKNRETILPGEVVIRDYAIVSDNFSESLSFPSADHLENIGTFDEHAVSMKEYWYERVAGIVDIAELPDQRLIDAYKAGYVYTLIIKDGDKLNVGENGYDGFWDHDSIGILSTLFSLGDFKYAKEYLATLIYEDVQYDDAAWKYSYPFALYLQKTDDIAFIEENFENIKSATHKIESDFDTSMGIMKETFAIDDTGYWTIDNFSALFGLTTYKYICEQLGEDDELIWAAELYNRLLEGLTDAMERLQQEKDISYISVSPVVTTEEELAADNANWASMFLFGRWTWEGYLFGAEQYGILLDQTDETYDYGFSRLYPDGNIAYSFGGYPGYSSGYNAGYGLAALRAEKYRDIGIKAYQFMIDNTQSSPFGWWEGIPLKTGCNSVEDIDIVYGTGSCPHMWGQALCTKALIDSIIAEKADGTVIIGRGLPAEWLGENISVNNYSVNGGKMSFSLFGEGDTLTLILEGDVPASGVSLELIGLKNHISGIRDPMCTFDNSAGTVTVPAGVYEVVIELK